MSIEVIARIGEPSWYDGGISFFGYDREKTALIEKLSLRVVEPGAAVEPFINLKKTEAQVLIDSLWDCGLRPSEGSGSAGAMAATVRHLEDMRTLVFTKKNGVR